MRKQIEAEAQVHVHAEIAVEGDRRPSRVSDGIVNVITSYSDLISGLLLINNWLYKDGKYNCLHETNSIILFTNEFFLSSKDLLYFG